MPSTSPPPAPAPPSGRARSPSKSLVGAEFGRLTVLSEFIRTSGGQRRRFTVCRCSCGNEANIDCNALTSGRQQSCGCLMRTNALVHGATKGHKPTTAYIAWGWLKTVMFNKNSPRYHAYGGAGVQMQESWVSSFEQFLQDMGDPPPDHNSIRRHDPNGHFTRENCYWGTRRKVLDSDLLGKVFGRLTLVGPDTEAPIRRRRWVAQCACGNTKSVLIQGLMRGTVRSCGCLRSERGRDFLAQMRAEKHSA